MLLVDKEEEVVVAWVRPHWQEEDVVVAIKAYISLVELLPLSGQHLVHVDNSLLLFRVLPHWSLSCFLLSCRLSSFAPSFIVAQIHPFLLFWGILL